MAQPSGTHSTYDIVGIRDDLASAVFRVDPVRTPFLNEAKQVPATNTTHEWQTQALAAAGTNYVIEGDDATYNAATARVRLANTTQISDKAVVVSGTSRAVNTSPVSDELNNQRMLKGLELKRDVELALLDNNAKVAGDDTTARETAGVPAYIITNINKNGSTDPTDGTGSYARSGGTDRAFTEAQLRDVLRKAWEAGGDPGTLLMNPFNKQQFSTFTGSKTQNANGDDKRVTNAVDFYVSDFGTHKAIPSQYCETDMCYVLDMAYWKVAVMPGRWFKETPLAKTGDADKVQIICEFALEACNEKASGIVADINAS